MRKKLESAQKVLGGLARETMPSVASTLRRAITVLGKVVRPEGKPVERGLSSACSRRASMANFLRRYSSLY